MGFDDDDQDEVEVSLEELHRMIEEGNEVEIDLDDFAAYMEEQSFKSAEEAEMEAERQEYAVSMRESLDTGNYYKALESAKELRKRGYLLYREEIDSCYEVCAEHNVLEALVFEADKFTKRGDGRPKAEAFRYLHKLSEMGYIESFRWLADCYYYGIGCEKNWEKAEKLYFEGMLFGRNRYCYIRYFSMRPERKEYDGGELLGVLVKNLSDGDCWYDYERVRIAELIMDGMIKEYRPESAYALLKGVRYSDDGISAYRLGECVLTGIGTTADPIVAKQLLESAIDDMEWVVRDFNDEWAKDMMEESYHDQADYIHAFENAQRLLSEAESLIKKDDGLDMIVLHDGETDEDQIYDDWYEEKPLFIKRSVGK
ncbi:MAG: SEL1-like repeat protein [Oribacterium sp.]|nr:SEL1-like repeat protein [Oribacterium sp.]MBO6309570.1 SEL1-like repeat protein [Oribacterium sp.]